MAVKTFYLALWMLLFLFAVVKGSCLEYGHSCWGAHGKRSGSSKIYHTAIKPPTEFDFQDSNSVNDKNSYDSAEEQLNDSTNSLSSSHDTDELIEASDKNSIKFKKFLYKKLNRTIGKERNFGASENDVKKTNRHPMITERWRRLPLYNVRRIQITRPDSNWLRELQQEQQINEDDYI